MVTLNEIGMTDFNFIDKMITAAAVTRYQPGFHRSKTTELYMRLATLLFFRAQIYFNVFGRM